MALQMPRAVLKRFVDRLDLAHGFAEFPALAAQLAPQVTIRRCDAFVVVLRIGDGVGKYRVRFVPTLFEHRRRGLKIGQPRIVRMRRRVALG